MQTLSCNELASSLLNVRGSTVSAKQTVIFGLTVFCAPTSMLEVELLEEGARRGLIEVPFSVLLVICACDDWTDRGHLRTMDSSLAEALFGLEGSPRS